MNNEANGKSLKKISEITKIIGVSRKALQEYDRLGLLHPTAKTEGGYWLYDEEAVQKITKIQMFSLVGYRRSEMKELLDDATDPAKHREIFCDAIEKLKIKRKQLDGIILWAETMSQVVGVPEMEVLRTSKHGDVYEDTTMLEDIKQTAERLSGFGEQEKDLMLQIMPLMAPLTVKIAALACCKEDAASDNVHEKMETLFEEWQQVFTQILRTVGAISQQESVKDQPLNEQLSGFRGFVETILKGNGSTEEAPEVKLNRMYGQGTADRIRHMVEVFTEQYAQY